MEVERMVDEKKEKIREERREMEDPEELKAVLTVVSEEVPGLIKGIMGSVFSEEAARDMGKAAGTFYKELKQSGIPDETAMKMTEDYIGMFTNFGDIFRRGKTGSEIGEELERKIKEKLAEKRLGQ